MEKTESHIVLQVSNASLCPIDSISEFQWISQVLDEYVTN